VAFVKSLKVAAFLAVMMQPAVAQAQQAPTASIAEMASTPLVRVNISESLRTPPDEASMTVGTQAKAATATAARRGRKGSGRARRATSHA
jgi:hypothetical protein